MSDTFKFGYLCVNVFVLMWFLLFFILISILAKTDFKSQIITNQIY